MILIGLSVWAVLIWVIIAQTQSVSTSNASSSSLKTVSADDGFTSFLELASAYGQGRSKRTSIALATTSPTFEQLYMSRGFLSDPCGLTWTHQAQHPIDDSDTRMTKWWDADRQCFRSLTDLSMSALWTELVNRKLSELGFHNDRVLKWYISSGERELDVQMSFMHTTSYTVRSLPDFYHAFIVRAMVPACQKVVFQPNWMGEGNAEVADRLVNWLTSLCAPCCKDQ
jgi:hypothetical protein